MISNMIAATALLASAPLANALGHAIVKNACNYQVKMCNVPASGGGYDEIDKWLQPNETYSQEYTELSNGNGWALKLSDSDSLEHVLQYEYTTHDDGIIWYDLSQVDGNPWYGNWQITTDSENCSPKQQASAAPSNNVVTQTVYQTIYARETAPARRAHRRHGHNEH